MAQREVSRNPVRKTFLALKSHAADNRAICFISSAPTGPFFPHLSPEHGLYTKRFTRRRLYTVRPQYDATKRCLRVSCPLSTVPYVLVRNRKTILSSRLLLWENEASRENRSFALSVSSLDGHVGLDYASAYEHVLGITKRVHKLNPTSKLCASTDLM
jgi:hypothetical protein